MNVKNNLSLSVEGNISPDPNDVTIFITQYWPRLYYSNTGLELRFSKVAQVWTSFASIVVTKNNHKQVTQWVKKRTAIDALKAVRTKYLFFKKISNFFIRVIPCQILIILRHLKTSISHWTSCNLIVCIGKWMPRIKFSGTNPKRSGISSSC